jgi:hypothetical protein
MENDKNMFTKFEFPSDIKFCSLNKEQKPLVILLQDL